MWGASSLRGVALAGAALLALAGCEGMPPAGPEPASSSAASSSSALTQSEVLPVGAICTPTGAHAKHEALTDCATCHMCGGVLQFDPAGPAIYGGRPLPTFDATAKTCSNNACHGMDAGTFTYPFQGGDGEVVWNTVSYGTTIPVTPSWYAVPPLCTACHGNPPRAAGYAWHGGTHANQGSTGAANQCQFCHKDAVSTNGVASGLSTATNCGPGGSYGSCAALHRNGFVEVQATFTSACFNCH
ncbi:MAG: hypothetical protein ACYC8T_31445 [Myxococcaceae bacterium]